ncbi:MAG TPA: C25 family cysteine peptidase [Bacteroidota bacterium]|nr:C25 family cysteine peptidase [Bacteroidota bacterium]
MKREILALALLSATAVLLPSLLPAQGKAFLVSAHPSELVVDYYPLPHRTEHVQLGGLNYTGFADAEVGIAATSPAAGLPLETFIIGIPPEGTPKVDLVSTTSESQPNVLLARPSAFSAPIAKGNLPTKTFVPVTNAANGSTGRPSVRISRITMFRYQRIAVVEFQPYQYNPSARTLTRFTSARIRITLPANAQVSAVADPHFESAYKSAILNYSQAKNWRVRPQIPPLPMSRQRTSGGGPNYEWFNPGQQYYRMKIAADGIYPITYADIQKLNIVPESVDPRRIEVFYKGISLSLYVVGGADGQFNPNDTVEFYGSRLYDAPGVANQYSDTSVYWVTFTGQNGKRAEVDSTLATQQIVTPDYFNPTVHVEQNKSYYYGDEGLPNNNQTEQTPGEGWYWNTLLAGNSSTYNTSLDNLYTTGSPPFQVTVKVHSSVYNQATPNQILTIAVNGTVVGTDSLAGYDDRALVAGGSVSLLKSGTNPVKLSSIKTAATLTDILVDWVELSYPRQFKVKSDTLLFLPDRLTPGQIAKFAIGTFTNDTISVYRLDTLGGIEKVFRQPPKLSGSTYTVTFTDTIAAQRRYLLVTRAKKWQLPALVPKTFQNLRSTSLGADYLIVAAAPFMNDAQRLATYRTQTGVGRTKVVQIDDIQDEFGFGFFDPVAIRRFVLAADSLWAPPMPSYLLFIGDASWDYKNFMAGTGQNFVPSYGNPVSDEYYGSSSSDEFLPTKFIGRIPCTTVDESAAAVDRIIAYESTPADIWNKRYLFISGGFDSTETLTFSQFCDNLISQYITPSPLAGIPGRIYRTITEIITSQETDAENAVINQGAVWIDYYGHGGTDTWGNGINSPNQLENSEGKRHVISDISCSTARFAEPEVESFGEEMYFGDAGGAIAYLGSAGFGFETPLQVIAQSIYQQMSVDSIREVGRLMLGAKLSLWKTGTGSVVTQEALQQYTLLGDPALKLAVPEEPDFAVSANQITSNPPIPSESDKSVVVSAVVSNYGLEGKDSVEVRVDHQFQNQTETVLDNRLPSVASLDTLSFTSTTFTKGGVHKITVSVDPGGTLNEITKANNTAQFLLYVNSASIFPVSPSSSASLHSDSVVLTLQNAAPSMQSWNLAVEVDTSSGFLSPARLKISNVPQGVVATSAVVPPGTLRDSTLYYWRGRFVGQGDSTNWVQGYFLTDNNFREQWIQDRSALFLTNSNAELIVRDTVSLDKHTSAAMAYSAGFNDGNSVLITLGNVNIEQGFANRGYNVAVINQFSGIMESFGAFSIYSLSGDTTLSLPLINFLNAIPYGRRVIMAIWDEGYQGKSEGLNEAIEACGSHLIRTLGFRGSWALIGWKGAPIGSVPEAIKNSGGGPVTVTDTLLFEAVDGSMVTGPIGPAARWKSIGMTVDTTTAGTHVTTEIIRTKKDGGVDTLRNIVPGQSLLSILPASTAASIQLKVDLQSDSLGLSPRLTRWWVDFDPPPELAVNYRSISLSGDSLLQGTPLSAHVDIFNIGAGRADGVMVKTSLINLPTGVTDVDTVTVPTIAPHSSAGIDQSFQTLRHVGGNNLVVQVDPALLQPETFQGNNIYSLPFTVRTDTIPPSFTVTFDGSTVYEGDYVSSQPTIVVRVSDNNIQSITDPSSVNLTLDNRRVTLGNNPDSLFSPASGSQNAVVTYRPQLATGDHDLLVQVSDVAGNLADTSAFHVTFKVQTESAILDVYNFPNPFSRDTRFTFNLVGSKVPDRLAIRIYTVAGRLVQEIVVSGSDLRVGFNAISWDGRDRDGNVLANGVYFYKVGMSVDGKSSDVIQKLAKVR